MENRPLVSFIIPVYKTPEQLLRNCLDSVLKYSQPMELICVLDSPGDPCEKVLDEYVAKEPQMRLLKNDRNRGVSYSRNRGMDAATGEYLAFVDADDEILSETYEAVVCFAARNLLDACAVSANNFKHETWVGVKYGDGLQGVLKDPEVGKVLAMAFDWAVYPLVLRRNYLLGRRIRFVEGRRYGEDFVFVTQVLCSKGCFGALNLNGYKSVGHSASACRASGGSARYVQGVSSSLDVLKIAVTEKVSQSLLSWYVVKTIWLSLLHRQINRYVAGEDRKIYCRLIREYFGLISHECREAVTGPTRILSKLVFVWPRIWFLPFAPAVMVLKALNRFNGIAK